MFGSFHQKIVGIQGRAGSIRFTPASAYANKPLVMEVKGDSSHLAFPAASKQSASALTLPFYAEVEGRGMVTIVVYEREAPAIQQEVTVPYAVFGEKALFVTLVICSNHHVGFNPGLNVADDLSDEVAGEGDGYDNAKRLLEPVFRTNNAPITWLIDSIVAKKAAPDLHRWSVQYGDDIGVMPTSLFFTNARDYNRAVPYEETARFLAEQVSEVESILVRRTSIVGIDQFVGSVGSHFVEAARAMGMQGIWGIGYDHFLCDTSMFHRGASWEAYKPDRRNFRHPAKDAASLWAFQWTARDILLTSRTPTGYSGSVMFSTDPDDIRPTGIMAAQDDYYNRLLEQYARNAEQNDFIVFTVHQEDHDVLFPDNNAYLQSFLERIDLPIVYATLEEVAQWLNLRYSPEEHPVSALRLSDVLHCHDRVIWNRGGVRKPEDWPSDPASYPDHAAYCDRDLQTITAYPDILPFRIYHYGEEQPFEPDGQVSETGKPAVMIELEETENADGRYFVITASAHVHQPRLTLMLWDRDAREFEQWQTTHSTMNNAALHDIKPLPGHACLLLVTLPEGISRIKLPRSLSLL